MQKFANSKLYKRVLVFALVACMLCSVLVAGIGTGITVKAADESLTLGVSLYKDGYIDEYKTQTISENGTYTFTFDAAALAGATGGKISTDINDCYVTETAADVKLTVTATISSDSDLAISHGWGNGAEENWGSTNPYVYRAEVDTWSAGSIQEYNWAGTETVTVKVTVSGISWPAEDTTTSGSDNTTSGSDETASDSDDTTGDDTTEEEPFVPTGTGYKAYLCYVSSDWSYANWGDADGYTYVSGDGSYTVWVKPGYDVNGSTMLFVEIADFAAAAEAAGVSASDIVVSNVSLTCEGETISVDSSKIVTGDLEGKGHFRIELYNAYGATSTAPAFDYAALAFSGKLQLNFTISGVGNLDGESSQPEEDEDTGLKGTTGSKKENGYVHDKGAIFVYTGDKDINDFTIATGWAFGAVHEINGKWGDSYFGEGGLAGVGTGEGTSVKGNGIYIKYWEDYRGIGYPAIQLSWDTDRIFYIGDITIFSSDWSTQAVFSVGDGFYRGPEERYAGTGEALLDGSNRWYYFGEGSYTAANTTEDTTTEDTTTGTIDTSNFTNGDLGLGDGEAGAYIMYADESWTNQYWYDGSVYTMNPENVKITGEGDYVVGLTGQASGLAFAALGIAGGEAAYPNYCFTITAMTVNGELINFEKPYTSSDDAITTRSNIYNAWVTALPDDARCAYGEVADCTWVPVDPADFANVTEFKVYFTVTAPETALDYDAKVVETLTNLVNDGTLTQEAVDQYIADNGIVVPEA